MNITRLSAPFAATSRRARIAIGTTLAAIALAAMASAAPSAHAATAHPTTMATVSNGARGEFHCAYGQVTFDFLTVPAGTGKTTYQPELLVSYGGAWHVYGYMPAETLYSYYFVSGETPLTVSVAHGYSYAVNVWVSSPGITETVGSFVDSGAGAGGYACAA